MDGIRISVSISDGIYLKNPLDTELGKRIIKAAIEQICDIGYEDFNFKRLAIKADTTEASVYRYFENKYKLLVYLTAWYWGFMHFMVQLDVRNLSDPMSQLKQAISTLVHSRSSILTPEYVDQARLHHVIVENASKVLHTKKVDQLNKEGYYANYKKMVGLIAQTIERIDPEFEFPVALASNLLDQSLNNEYYIEHLPSLTDKLSESDAAAEHTIKMVTYLIDRLLHS